MTILCNNPVTELISTQHISRKLHLQFYPGIVNTICIIFEKFLV
jgi:hypothetical protein